MRIEWINGMMVMDRLFYWKNDRENAAVHRMHV